MSVSIREWRSFEGRQVLKFLTDECENTEHLTVISPSKVSSPFRFVQYETEKLGTDGTLHMCGKRSCPWEYPRVYCVHETCIRTAFLDLTPELFATSDLMFTPPIKVQASRRSHLKARLTETLCEEALQNFPMEVCGMIAEHLIVEYAAVSCQMRFMASQKLPKTSVLIDLSADIFAGFIKYDGGQYVRSLYNACDPISKGDICIYKAQERASYVVHAGWDHLGVRQIVIENSDKRRERKALQDKQLGVWWTTLSREGGIRKFKICHDVSQEQIVKLDFICDLHTSRVSEFDVYYQIINIQ